MSKRIRRLLVKGLVGALAIMPMSAYAQADTPQYIPPSQWAMEDFADAEAYGLLTKDWMMGLRNPITVESFGSILKGVDFKLAALEKEVETKSKKIEVPKAITRKAVLMSLYEQATQYKWAAQTDLGQKEPITWMKEKGILKGEDLERLCTLEEALSFAGRFIEEVYGQRDQGAKGLVWEATKGENTVYLVGTVHMGNSMLYPLHKDLAEKFEKSSAVAFEVDFNNQTDLAYLEEQQFLADGSALKDHVSEEAYKKSVEILAPLGLTEEMVNRYKPITIANTLTMLSAQEAPTSELPLPVLDVYLQGKAYGAGKEVVELEGIRYQTDFLYNAPMETQVIMLEDTVKGLEKGEGVEETSGEIINNWLKLWAAGDEETFGVSFPKNEKTGVKPVDDFNEELFDKRDKNMTQKVVEMLSHPEGKTYMVVVGAGHMIGETGIVKGLLDLGYDVKACE